MPPVAVPNLSGDGDAPPEEDTPLERELNEMISAADESQDAVSQAEPRETAAAALPSPLEVKRLFAALQIRPGANGGIVIEAPPDAAAGLAALFEGMAQLLRAPASEP